jgi:poly(A) polymerase
MERFDLHLELHRIDCLASHGNLEAYEFCKRKLEEIRKYPPPPTRIINGHDLIGMGFRPGKEFTQIFRAIEDAILEGTVTNRDEALEFVQKQYLRISRHE